VKRGEIHWVDLKPRSGSEQKGKRPCLIISNDGFNLTPNWRSIIVIPLSTAKVQSRRGPTAIFLPKGSGNLTRPSIALCHRITTIDRAKLQERIGSLKDHQMAAIERGIRAALDIL